jgi:hypothetical protein
MAGQQNLRRQDAVARLVLYLSRHAWDDAVAYGEANFDRDAQEGEDWDWHIHPVYGIAL